MISATLTLIRHPTPPPMDRDFSNSCPPDPLISSRINHSTKSRKKKWMVSGFMATLLLTGSIFVWSVFQQLSYQQDIRTKAVDDTQPIGQSVSAGFGNPLPLTNLDLHSFFLAHSGYSNTTSDFGVYALRSVGSSLYVTISSGLPAGTDGALLAKYDGSALNPIQVDNNSGDPRINEQGINTMLVSNGGGTTRLILPGTDPCCDDGWDFGNVYVHTTTTNSLQKYRQTSGLDHVVHFWGLAEVDTTVFGAVTSLFSRPGQTDILVGEIVKSSNGGQNWQRVTVDPNILMDPTRFLATDRIYDIIPFNNKIYITNMGGGYTGTKTLQYTADEGLTWDRVEGVNFEPRPKMVVFQDRILGVTEGGNELFTLDSDNTTQHYPLIVGGVNKQISLAYTYQVFALANTYLYTITNDGLVIRSQTLQPNDWEVVATIDGNNLGWPIAIEYWAEQQQLVVATRGQQAQLVTIALNTAAPSPTPTSAASPTPTNIVYPTSTDVPPSPTPSSPSTPTPTQTAPLTPTPTDIPYSSPTPLPTPTVPFQSQLSCPLSVPLGIKPAVIASIVVDGQPRQFTLRWNNVLQNSQDSTARYGIYVINQGQEIPYYLWDVLDGNTKFAEGDKYFLIDDSVEQPIAPTNQSSMTYIWNVPRSGADIMGQSIANRASYRFLVYAYLNDGVRVCSNQAAIGTWNRPIRFLFPNWLQKALK